MSAGVAILCPGQGAQALAMGKAWYDASSEAKAVFDQADVALGSRLGGALTSLCFDGPIDRLNQTDVSQPAIFVTSIASYRGMLAAKGMAEHDLKLAGTAGLSLGEYTALVVSGALSFEDGLELVTLRGRAMQDAADSPEARAGGGGGMLALIGATDEQGAQVCAAAAGSEILVCANFNAPGQVVLSGHMNACRRAVGVAEAMGLKSAQLPVAGAFHSPLMAQAAARLQTALESARFKEARCPVMSNVTGREHAAESGGSFAATIRTRLVEQLTHPVRWVQNCVNLASLTPTDFLELAPGKTLSGLMRRIDRSIKVTTHDTP